MHRLLAEDWQERERNPGSLSKFRKGYEARHLSLKGNVTRVRHAREPSPSSLLGHTVLVRLIPYSAAVIPPFCVRDD